MEELRRHIVLPTSEPSIEGYEEYFGIKTGSYGLLQALEALSVPHLQTLLNLLLRTNLRRGRIFIIGNGGSYDNALVMSSQFQRLGINASVPGYGSPLELENPEVFPHIFSTALEREKLNENDLLLPLSGSGSSVNIVNAITYAQEQGAKVFALGGRNGGAMARLLDSECVLIASHDHMEIIEDIHCAVAQLIAQAVEKIIPLEAAKQSLFRIVRESLTPTLLSRLALLATQISHLTECEGNLFLIGTSIGVRHFRLDAERGYTAGLPIRGICAPEVLSYDAALATMNDDGVECVLADSLVKYRPGRFDLAILFRTPGSENVLNAAYEVVQESYCGIREVGLAHDDIDLTNLMSIFGVELTVSIVNHATASVVRGALWKEWQVRPLDVVMSEDGLRKKLSPSLTRELELQLRRADIIAPNEVVTFVYGRPHAAKDPAVVGKKRVYY